MKQWLLKKLPFLYQVRIWQLQMNRRASDLRNGIRFARSRRVDSYRFLVKKHKSVLRRVLGNTDPILQENKIVNLQIALPHIDGIVIHPEETLSFWKLIGKTTQEKGYIEGLMLSRGKVVTGVGGGLCQLANLLFWLALHTPLRVVERHHHSFDIFPDHGRTVPFGTGTSVFYNYIDLRFYNPTPYPLQFRLWLTEQFLEGMVVCSKQLKEQYRVEKRNHRFYQLQEKWYRENEIWRLTIDPENGSILQEELIIRNKSEVRYEVLQLGSESSA
jgi:vancomycin resistance protein VanW